MKCLATKLKFSIQNDSLPLFGGIRFEIPHKSDGTFVIMGIQGTDIHYEYTDIEHFYSLSLYPYIIINEYEVLLIKNDCSGAVYLNSESTVKEYQNFFQKKYKISE